MVETQAVGVRVILPCVPLVVDLRELKSYKNNIGYIMKIFPLYIKDEFVHHD